MSLSGTDGVAAVSAGCAEALEQTTFGAAISCGFAAIATAFSWVQLWGDGASEGARAIARPMVERFVFIAMHGHA